MNVGIEIEWENVENTPTLNNWLAITDHSLRNNGAEFVIKEPVEIDKLRGKLKELETILELNKVEQSVRTSVHVHVDFRNTRIYSVLKFIFLWLIHEDYFFKISGSKRDKCPYCLTTRFIDFNHYILHDEDGSYLLIDNIKETYCKYTAMNLIPLTTQGSIEIRTMEGTDDLERIHAFVLDIHDKLYSVCNKSIVYIINTLIKDIKNFRRFLIPFCKIYPNLSRKVVRLKRSNKQKVYFIDAVKIAFDKKCELGKIVFKKDLEGIMKCAD